MQWSLSNAMQGSNSEGGVVRKLIAAIVLSQLVPVYVASAQTSQPPTKRQLLEAVSEMLCNARASDPIPQRAFNHFRMSQMQVCQCVVSETTYAMESDPQTDTFLAYAIRSNQTRNSEFANPSEKYAFDTYQTKFNNAWANCVHRLAGR